MNRNSHPAPKDDDAVSASFSDEEDDDATSGEEEEEIIVGETQPAQQQELPILTSPITDGGRYQLRSTPERLAISQRGHQQQQP